MSSDDAYDSSNVLYLVDGSGFIFRAFHALPPLTRSDGTPVNAVLGFCNMLLRLLTEREARQVAVIFDAARENFRNDIYAEYKANRSDPPEELIPQFGLIREAVEAFSLPAAEMEGYEADDLIATYARLAEKRGQKVVIVSSDKDLMQLVRDGVAMLDPIKYVELGVDDVVKKFGVAPDKVVDVQALAGDSVDNIPGVPGIGLKTAAQLIEDYGDLETLLASAEGIKQPKRRQNLIDFAEQARISHRLVTLDADVPVTISLEDLALREPDHDKLLEFLGEQEFRSLITRLERRFQDSGGLVRANGGGTAGASAKGGEGAQTSAGYELVTDREALARWVGKARAAGVVAIDTETDSLTPAAANLIGISMSTAKGEACYIPIAHVAPDAGTLDSVGKDAIRQIPLDDLVSDLTDLMAAPDVLKVGHNMKYDMQMLRGAGLTVTPIDDTMLLSYVLDGGRHGHGLDELAETYIGHRCIKFTEVAGSGKSQVTFDRVPLDKALDYAAEDADMTLQLWHIFKPRLAVDHMATVYERLERPLVPVVAGMESAGIKVDRRILGQMSKDFAATMETLEDEIHKLAGHGFNVGSPKQLGTVLFDELQLPGGRKLKSGGWSTDSSVLEPLAPTHDIVARVLEWRSLSKLKGTYTDALPGAINERTGRVHTSYSLATTNTGRLSSSDPNLQNIPIRTEAGRKIRTAFVAEDGHVLMSADYSQIELRLVAEIAGIEALKDAFRDGHDIHAMTASAVFGVPLDEMTSETRRKAKAINFGIIYGISGYGLAQQLGIPPREASSYISDYLQRFPELATYMDETKAFCREHGYVRTLFGRKCFIPTIKDSNPARRNFGERQAINAPIQGTAADIIKRAMIRMPPALDAAGLGARMLLQVHDELIFEVPDNEVEKTGKLVRETMESVASLSVPLVTEVGVGPSWAKAH